jgi:hypothetical protein
MLAPSWLLVAPRDHRCHQPASQRPDATDDTGGALLLRGAPGIPVGLRRDDSGPLTA